MKIFLKTIKKGIKKAKRNTWTCVEKGERDCLEVVAFIYWLPHRLDLVLTSGYMHAQIFVCVFIINQKCIQYPFLIHLFSFSHLHSFIHSFIHVFIHSYSLSHPPPFIHPPCAVPTGRRVSVSSRGGWTGRGRGGTPVRWEGVVIECLTKCILL